VHDARSSASSCTLFPSKVLASELAGQRGVRAPSQPSGSVQHERPTLLDRGDVYSCERPDKADDGGQHATDGVVVSQSIEAEREICDANSIQTVPPSALEP
jgi:hypothetical protein